MNEHNKTYYSLEELKRARDCYEDYQDGEEVYYFVGALRYAYDEIERLNKEKNILIKNAEHNDKVVDKVNWENMFFKKRIDKAIEYIDNLSNEPNVFGHYGIDGNCKKHLLNILKGVDKE